MPNTIEVGDVIRPRTSTLTAPPESEFRIVRFYRHHVLCERVGKGYNVSFTYEDLRDRGYVPRRPDQSKYHSKSVSMWDKLFMDRGFSR